MTNRKIPESEIHNVVLEILRHVQFVDQPHTATVRTPEYLKAYNEAYAKILEYNKTAE
jgi:hypothetical protein